MITFCHFLYIKIAEQELIDDSARPNLNQDDKYQVEYIMLKVLIYMRALTLEIKKPRKLTLF